MARLIQKKLMDEGMRTLKRSLRVFREFKKGGKEGMSCGTSYITSS